MPVSLPAPCVMRHFRMAHVPAGLRRVVTADRRTAVGLVTGLVPAVFLAGLFFTEDFLTAVFFAAVFFAAVFFAAVFFTVPALERADADRSAATSARSRAASARASSSFSAGTSPRRVTAASTSPRTSAVRCSRFVVAAANSSSANAPTWTANLPVATLTPGIDIRPCAASMARARVSSPRPDASWTYPRNDSKLMLPPQDGGGLPRYCPALGPSRHLRGVQRDPTSSSPNPDQRSSPTARSSSRDNAAPSPANASIVTLRRSLAPQTALNAARSRSLSAPPRATASSPALDTRADASPQIHLEESVASCTASAYGECSERRSVAT